MELEKVLKENPTSPTSCLNLESLNSNYLDETNPVSSSGIALQQSELKKETILSFLDYQKMSSFKELEGILDEHSAAVVTRYLASLRALTRRFDMYLQQVILYIMNIITCDFEWKSWHVIMGVGGTRPRPLYRIQGESVWLWDTRN